MEVIRVTELTEFQFFLLKQIYSLREKHFRTSKPFENVSIGAYPKIKFDSEFFDKLQDKGLFLPNDFRGGICLLEFMVHYEIHKKEYSSQEFVKIKLDIPHCKVYEFITYLKDYVQNSKKQTHKISC